MPLQERSSRLDRNFWVEMLCDTAIELLRELQRDSILPAYNVRARARRIFMPASALGRGLVRQRPDLKLWWWLTVGSAAGQAAGIRQVEKEISELHGLIMKKLDEMP